MSSKSPGHQKHNLITSNSAEFHHQGQCMTSPDGNAYVLTRPLSGGFPDTGGACSRDSGYCVNTSDGASTCSSSTTDATEGEGGTLLVLEPKSLRSFTTNDEYLYAMKEDLADWFSCLYKMDITADTFFSVLETGVLLCQHANKVQDFSKERREQGETLEMRSYFIRNVPVGYVSCRENVKPETFQARDNVSNFIAWGRQLGIPEVLSFETDDLVLRKNEKNVILCLLEIARVGAKLGMLAPTLVQMEEEIDAELAGEEVQPKAQIKTCDMRSLDEMVRDLVGRCTCPVQFPMVKVGDGKYKIGDSRSLIFVRILRNHVMVRVGGGWDTLENYLNKHDPCQCNYRGHRATSLGPSTRGGPPAAQRQATHATNSATGANNATTRQQNALLSPRRMSTPALPTTPTPKDRNRSTSPKHPTRSKSPTLMISRHLQGNQKPNFTVNNSSSNTNIDTSKDVNSSASPSTSGNGVVVAGTKCTNSTNQNCNARTAVSVVSQSWSQPSGGPSRIPTTGSANRCKSPSPGPSSSSSMVVNRLRSQSPLTTSHTDSAHAKKAMPQANRVFTRASSSSTLLARTKGQGGGGGVGEVKVGTPRSIKRAAMNSSDCEDEEDDEYDNEDDDDDDDEEYYDDDDNGVNDDRTWRDRGRSARHDADLQFNVEDIDQNGGHPTGSVSLEDSYEGRRPGLERVSESSDVSESASLCDGKKSSMEKINTMTLTEFKSLLSTALSTTDNQQQQQQQQQQQRQFQSQNKDQENPNICVKPSSLQLSSSLPATNTGITSTASTPGASTDISRQLNWDSLRDKARLVRDSISNSVNSRKPVGGSTASPGTVRRSLPPSPGDDGSRSRAPPSSYNYGDRPKTPQALRRNSATGISSRPKTPTSSVPRSKTPTAMSRPKTPSSSTQSRSRTPSSLERNREEYKMARSKTPSQMKRDAVAKVAGAISNWVESRPEMDSHFTPTAGRSRPKTPVSRRQLSLNDNDDEEIMGTFANNDQIDNLVSSIRERPSTPSLIPKPCFTPRPATPKKSYSVDDGLCSTTSSAISHRPSVPANPPLSLSLSQDSYDSTLNTPESENLHIISDCNYNAPPPQTHNTSCSRVISRTHPHTVSAPTTPGSANESRNIVDSLKTDSNMGNTNATNVKTYKDIYTLKRATTPTQSTSIPRSQTARCVTPGPREKWSLGENSNSTARNSSQSRISSYQNGPSSSKRRGSLNNTEMTFDRSISNSHSHSNQFVVTNEITFSDDEEINEMLQNAAALSSSAPYENHERKMRSASVDARRLARQNANGKDVVVISRTSKGKHNVQVSTNSPAGQRPPLVKGRTTTERPAPSSVANSTRFRSQTPDPSMFRKKITLTKTSGKDDMDSRSSTSSKSGSKSVNRTEAWVDSTLSDTKRKLPPRPKRGKSLGGDIPVSELEPRPLEEIMAILPENQSEINIETLDAPPEDPEMYKKMEKLFEKYREMELRASVNDVPGGGGGKMTGGAKSSDPSSTTRSIDTASKSTPSVASMKTSSGSMGSSSGRSSSHQQRSTNSAAISKQQRPSSSLSGKPRSCSIRSNASSEDIPRGTRASSLPPRTFQKQHGGIGLSPAQSENQFVDDKLSLESTTSSTSMAGSETGKQITSLKDIDSETAKDPTALILKIKEILRVRPRKDENPKVPTRIPAPSSLSKYKRSKSVSNLCDSNELTLKENHSGSNNGPHQFSLLKQNGSHDIDKDTDPSNTLHRANSNSSTNIAYSEFVFSDDKVEEADHVSELHRAWSVQSDSSDTTNRSETPVPKLSTPLTTGRSTFINRKLDRNGRGLSNDKENALSNSQSSLSSRSAFSATEDEAEYV